MPEAGAELDALADELYAVWLRYHPDLAQAVGLRPTRGWLPPLDDDDLAALCSWLESAILGLDEIDFEALDPDRQVDFELMLGAARVEHAELLDPDWRRRDPGRFLPVAEIYRLTLDPPETLRAPLAELLAAIPERLRHAQALLRAQSAQLAPLLVRAAAREAERGRCYLRDLIRAPWLQERCAGVSELETLAESARTALAGYRDFLSDDLVPRARGALGGGVARLRRRLRYLHFMDADPAALAAALTRALRETEAALESLPERAEPPPGDLSYPRVERLALHRRIGEALARELEASALATLPRAPLRVAAAPPCPWHGAREAVYLAGTESATLFIPALVPPETGETLAQVRERCLSDGWCGSHLLFWSAPQQARRLVRRVANGTSLGAAWTLDLSVRLAERAGDPARLRDALVRRRERLQLARLDLDLHGAGIAGEAALERAQSLGLDPRSAESAVVRIALAPGDALAGALGLSLLQAARARAAGLDARAFNDRLLSQGPIPLPLAIARAFGEARLEQSWAAVLGDAGARPL